MDEENEEHGEAYNLYLELSKPTEEDFKRIFTEYELRDLCLKHKSRVDMYRWNVVNDYRILFTESGRYQRWSERDRLGMLAKAVNKMKRSVLYNDEEIKETRKKEWEFQLKENILSLNFWLRKRSKQTPTMEVIESDANYREMQSQFDVSEESVCSSELSTQSEIVPTVHRELNEEFKLELEVHTESMNSAELLTQSQRIYRELDEEVQLQLEVHTETMNSAVLLTQSQRHHREFEQANFQIPADTESISTEEQPETVIHEYLCQPVVETYSEEVAPEIENMYGINTFTMSIDSQIPTQELNDLQSQEVIPPHYDDFKNIIPLTSTQSQSQ